MKKKTFKTQADLFSFVLDEYVDDEETCISEFCFKNKAQAYENLKAKRNNLAEEWNRLTEERERQIRADAIDEVIAKCKKGYQTFSQDTICKIWLSTLEELKEQK